MHPPWEYFVPASTTTIDNTFLDPTVFSTVDQHPDGMVVSILASTLIDKFGKSYPWAIGKRRQLPSGYILAKRKEHYESGRPIISFADAPFRPMLNILARMIFQLFPVACPQHFATGDVYHLLSILRQAPEHGDLKLYNQDLPGICSWTFSARIWMSATTKCSLSIQDEATTLETSSRDERSDVLM